LADGWTVVWTRGRGCAELAGILDTGVPRHVEDDPRTACIAARADLMVAAALTSFDLVPLVVPAAVDFNRVTGVTAAVAGGPHTSLAARVAERIARVLDASGTVVSVSRNPESDRDAIDMLEQIGDDAPMLEQRILRARSARAVVNELSESTLLVVGAPGGSWLQRQFFGPGKRLMSAAPNGVVVVRDAPARCFQEVAPAPAALGTALRVEDALQVVDSPATPVLDGGRLLGIVRRDGLDRAAPGATVGDVMDDPVFVYVDDPLDDVAELTEFLDGAPVPVIDHEGYLLGSIRS
jgi:hypothetical protein